LRWGPSQGVLSTLLSAGILSAGGAESIILSVGGAESMMQGGGGAMTTSRQMKGNQEEKCTRGGGVL
jgi:hypothetical protein